MIADIKQRSESAISTKQDDAPAAAASPSKEEEEEEVIKLKPSQLPLMNQVC